MPVIPGLSPHSLSSSHAHESWCNIFFCIAEYCSRGFVNDRPCTDDYSPSDIKPGKWCCPIENGSGPMRQYGNCTFYYSYGNHGLHGNKIGRTGKGNGNKSFSGKKNQI